jgi:hypothetical protein
MQAIKQSESTAAHRTIHLQAINTADDSPYTGALSGADLKILKNDGAEADSAGTATHEGGGRFSYVFTAGEVDTYGVVSARINKSGVFSDVFPAVVVAYDPYAPSNLGLTNLDASIASRLASATYAAPTALLTSTDGVETGLTLQGALRLMVASVAGRRSGVNTGVELMRDYANSKTRITMTFDSNGNTTAVTYDPS